LTQRILRFALFGDIGICAKPSDNFAHLVVDRHYSRQEGAKDAVGAPEWKYHVERLPGCDRLLPTCQDSWKNLGVVNGLPANRFASTWTIAVLDINGRAFVPGGRKQPGKSRMRAECSLQDPNPG
jgi:hypothetical protein